MDARARFLDYSSPTPADDLALDEAIQVGLEEGTSPPTWRVWQARSPAIILGTGQQHALEVNESAARTHGLPVLRRHSGGGAVLIGPGVINYSGFYYYEGLAGSQTITGAMQAALEPVRGALEKLGVETVFAGLSDLAVPEAGGVLKKIAGNSQARKRRSVLVHGTILADPDWEMLAEVLRFPSRVPEYRVGRDHRAFLTSLKALDCPFQTDQFSQALQVCISSRDSVNPGPDSSELDAATNLVKEKYSKPEWNLRR